MIVGDVPVTGRRDAAEELNRLKAEHQAVQLTA